MSSGLLGLYDTPNTEEEIRSLWNSLIIERKRVDALEDVIVRLKKKIEELETPKD